MERLEHSDLYVLFVPWSNMLVMTNASINICIYCMFSEKYRKLMCHYLNFCCVVSKLKASNNSFHTLNVSSF